VEPIATTPNIRLIVCSIAGSDVDAVGSETTQTRRPHLRESEQWCDMSPIYSTQAASTTLFIA
jgi:hypothetical protein